MDKKLFLDRKLSAKLRNQLSTFRFTLCDNKAYNNTPSFLMLLELFGKTFENDEHILDMLDDGWLEIGNCAVVEVATGKGKSLYTYKSSEAIYGAQLILNVFSNILNKTINLYLAVVNEKVVKCAVIGKVFNVLSGNNENEDLYRVAEDHGIGGDLARQLRAGDIVSIAPTLGNHALFVMNKHMSNSVACKATTAWRVLKTNTGSSWLITPTGVYTRVNVQSNIVVEELVTQDVVMKSLVDDKEYRVNKDVANFLKSKFTKGVMGNLLGNLELIPVEHAKDFSKLSKADVFIETMNMIAHELDAAWFKRAMVKSLNQSTAFSIDDKLRDIVYNSNQAVKHSDEDLTPGGKSARVHRLTNGGADLGYWSLLGEISHDAIVNSKFSTNKADDIVLKVDERTRIDTGSSVYNTDRLTKHHRCTYTQLSKENGILSNAINELFPSRVRQCMNNRFANRIQPITVSEWTESTSCKISAKTIRNIDYITSDMISTIITDTVTIDRVVSLIMSAGTQETRRMTTDGQDYTSYSSKDSVFRNTILPIRGPERMDRYSDGIVRPACNVGEIISRNINGNQAALDRLKNELRTIAPEINDSEFGIVIDQKIARILPLFIDFVVKDVENSEEKQRVRLNIVMYLAIPIKVKGAYLVNSYGEKLDIEDTLILNLNTDFCFCRESLDDADKNDSDEYKSLRKVEQSTDIVGVTLESACLTDLDDLHSKASLMQIDRRAWSLHHIPNSYATDTGCGSAPDLEHSPEGLARALCVSTGNSNVDYARGVVCLNHIKTLPAIIVKGDARNTVFRTALWRQSRDTAKTLSIEVTQGHYVVKLQQFNGCTKSNSEYTFVLKDKYCAITVIRNVQNIPERLYSNFIAILRLWQGMLSAGEVRKSVYMAVAGSMACATKYTVNAMTLLGYMYGNDSKNSDMDMSKTSWMVTPLSYFENFKDDNYIDLDHIMDCNSEAMLAEQVKDREQMLKLLELLINNIALSPDCLIDNSKQISDNAINMSMIDNAALVAYVDEEEEEYENYYEDEDDLDLDDETVDAEVEDMEDIEDSEDEDEYADELGAEDYYESDEETDEELEDGYNYDYDDEELEDNLSDEDSSAEQTPFTSEQWQDDSMGSFIDADGRKVTWLQVMYKVCKSNPNMQHVANDYNSLALMWKSNYDQAGSKENVEGYLKTLWAM